MKPLHILLLIAVIWLVINLSVFIVVSLFIYRRIPLNSVSVEASSGRTVKAVMSVEELEELAPEKTFQAVDVENPPEKMADEDETVCAICVDEVAHGDTVRTLPCNHVYHSACLVPWVVKKGTCPLCKYSCLPEPVEQNLQQNDDEARIVVATLS